MIETFKTQYKGIKDFKENISYYAAKFQEESVICFRDADISIEEQVEIAISLGDHLGSFPNTKMLKNKINKQEFEKNHFYQENHKRAYIKKTENDEIIVPWHLEHWHRDNRTIAGIWHMITFLCDEESGKTYFVDTNKVWQLLNSQDQNFLKRCRSLDYYDEKAYEADCVGKHWKLDQDIVQMQFFVFDELKYLSKIDGQSPNKDQIENFNRIMNFCVDQIKNNESIRIVHKWKQGDILIPDLNKLAHAVTGGFKPEERYFKGIWVTQDAYDKSEDRDIIESVGSNK